MKKRGRFWIIKKSKKLNETIDNWEKRREERILLLVVVVFGETKDLKKICWAKRKKFIKKFSIFA